MVTEVETDHIPSITDADLAPRGRVFPSPRYWGDQVFYFLLPDRFSDGNLRERPVFRSSSPEDHRVDNMTAWRAAGKKWQGGTLKGIEAQLDYLSALGVSALWIAPVWKQHQGSESYHGYAIQDFLDVDPHFGSRQGLRDLCDAAHERGMYVIIDIVYNHSAHVWYYDVEGSPFDMRPYDGGQEFPVLGWRGRQGQVLEAPVDREDGVWPRELQRFDRFSRRGHIVNFDPTASEDPLSDDVEYRRGDFFDLKDLALGEQEVLDTFIRIYQFWIGLSDCDGFRVDTVKHLPRAASRRFCEEIRAYARRIGKENFLLVGEVAGGGTLPRAFLETAERNLDAFLDIGDPPNRLINFSKGFAPQESLFDLYEPSEHDLNNSVAGLLVQRRLNLQSFETEVRENLEQPLAAHRLASDLHISVLDDHDMVGRPWKRIAALPQGAEFELMPIQVAHAVATQLTLPGIPCIYYGTEQALDGNEDFHDVAEEPLDPSNRVPFGDRYVRESMFGGTFGAFRTEGCHFFDPNHPTYLRIAAVARVRQGSDQFGAALRHGRLEQRLIALGDGQFSVSPSGVAAWSRILFDTEVVMVFNTNAAGPVNCHVELGLTHHAGSTFRELYRGDWTDQQLRESPKVSTGSVVKLGERHALGISLPPVGFTVVGTTIPLI